MFLLLGMLTLAASALAAATNSVTLTELAGSAQNYRPFTISRIFAQGEIVGYAQPTVAGNPLTSWQCDRMNTWPDGSLKHALISFRYTVPANGSVIIVFVNNANPSSAGSPIATKAAALTQVQMLAFNSSRWGADIEATASKPCNANVLSGNTCAANVRTILGAGTWRYWLQGPVVTQVIVEDRSTALAYDFGFDSYNSLHPIFVLSFYAGWTGVKVEAILENMWSTKLEDISYSVAVKSGSTLANTQYSKSSFLHYAAGRWRKVFWDGSAPGSVKTDLNFPYIVSSLAVPNFDTSLTVTSVGINAEVTAFGAGDKGADYGNNGQYATYFPTSGGRSELGYFERFFTRYLYTFSPSLQPIFDANTAISGYVPIHYRESRNDSTTFCAASCTGGNATVPAFGRVLSIDARPTIWTGNWGSSSTSTADRIIPTGISTNGPWTVDQAHQADFAFVPYLVTGDWYLLEELEFWSSYNLSSNNAVVDQNYGRHGNWGILGYQALQPRGWAWSMRNLAHTAFFMPDGTPESQYFTTKLLNNFAVAEGEFQITNGSYPPADSTCPSYNASTAAMWCWGKMTLGQNLPNPLHLPAIDGYATWDPTIIDPKVTQYPAVPFEDNLIRLVFKRIVELGYPTATATQQAIASSLIHMLADPALNPYLTDAYRSPGWQITPGPKWFQTWGSWFNAWVVPYRTMTKFDGLAYNAGDFDFGYLQIARAAASTLPGLSDAGLTGESAWNWINDPARGVSNYPGLNENPKWAIVPRVKAASSSNPCDINGDAVVNLADVQLSVQAALGLRACVADLDHDGLCSIVDVQRIVKAALGGACLVTPAVK